jgi:hypothetical protein
MTFSEISANIFKSDGIPFLLFKEAIYCLKFGWIPFYNLKLVSPIFISHYFFEWSIFNFPKMIPYFV